MAKKAKEHALQKWSNELEAYNRLLDASFDMERQIQLQRERVHKAYQAYTKVREK